MRIKLAFVVYFWLNSIFLFSQTPHSSPDPFDLPLPGARLNDVTIVTALAGITADLPIGVSVEYELVSRLDPSGALRRFTATIPAGTVAEVTKAVVNLDPSFTWMRHGNVINVVPTDKASDPAYVFNRVLTTASLRDVSRADVAAVQVVSSLPDKHEQLAVLTTGGSISFAEPWTITFSNVTVREALDRIAQQLGDKYGWQLEGSTEFRVLTFHARLQPFEPERPPVPR